MGTVCFQFINEQFPLSLIKERPLQIQAEPLLSDIQHICYHEIFGICTIIIIRCFFPDHWN